MEDSLAIQRQNYNVEMPVIVIEANHLLINKYISGPYSVLLLCAIRPVLTAGSMTVWTTDLIQKEVEMVSV